MAAIKSSQEEELSGQVGYEDDSLPARKGVEQSPKTINASERKTFKSGRSGDEEDMCKRVQMAKTTYKDLSG